MNAAKLRRLRIQASTRRAFAAFFAFVLLAAVLPAACMPVTPIPPTTAPTLALTATSRFSTHEGPVIRATLPPTWTITPSPLPTLTPAATRVTPTKTPTPAPGMAELCPSFSMTYSFSDGHVFHWNDTLTMVLGTDLSAISDPNTGKNVPLVVRFLATNPLDGQNLGAQIPGAELGILQLPIYELPEPGLYRWQAGVYGEGIGDQCVQGGWFIVVRTNDDLATLAAATVQAATATAHEVASLTAAAPTQTAPPTEMVE